MDDDFSFSDLVDPQEADSDPTAHGIVQCLRMLLEEAASLRLPRTLAALRAAITTCADEGDTGDGSTIGDDLGLRGPRVLLH